MRKLPASRPYISYSRETDDDGKCIPVGLTFIPRQAIGIASLLFRVRHVHDSRDDASSRDRWTMSVMEEIDINELEASAGI